jgi:hypothetical protein
MTRVTLLERLRDETNEALKDLILPTKPQKNRPNPPSRIPEVYLMRLPDSAGAKEKAPYVIHQAITAKDIQRDGERSESSTVIRSICAVYADTEDAGGLSLLNLMERLRIHLLKKVLIGNQFMLDLEEGLEMLIYPDNTAPFFAGEMASVWKSTGVEREVSPEWRQK